MVGKADRMRVAWRRLLPFHRRLRDGRRAKQPYARFSAVNCLSVPFIQEHGFYVFVRVPAYCSTLSNESALELQGGE